MQIATTHRTPDAAALLDGLREIDTRLHLHALRTAAVTGVTRSLDLLGLIAVLGVATNVIGGFHPTVAARSVLVLIAAAVSATCALAYLVAARLHRPNLESSAVWADQVTSGNDRIVSALALTQHRVNGLGSAAIRNGLDHLLDARHHRLPVDPLPTRRLLFALGTSALTLTAWLVTSGSVPPSPAAERPTPIDLARPSDASSFQTSAAVTPSPVAQLRRDTLTADDAKPGPASPGSVQGAAAQLASAVGIPDGKREDGAARTSEPSQIASPDGASSERTAAAPAQAYQQGAPTPPTASPSTNDAPPPPPSKGASSPPPSDAKAPPPEQRQSAGGPPPKQTPSNSEQQAPTATPPAPTDKANGKGQGGPATTAKRSRGVAPLLLETRLPDTFAGQSHQGPSARTTVSAPPAPPAVNAASAQPPTGPGVELPVSSGQVPPASRQQVTDYFQAYERLSASEDAGQSHRVAN